MPRVPRQLVGVLLLAAAAPAIAVETRALTGSVPPAAAAAVQEQPVADHERIGPFLVVLEPDGHAGPADGRDVAALYGATPARMAAVRSWLERAGLRILRESAQRTTLSVEGSAAAVRAAFGTPLVRARLAGRRVRVPGGVPRLPAALGVRGVIGLDDLPRFRPLSRGAAVIAPGETALDATDFALVYGSEPLLAAGIRGAGASIAVVARSNYADADLVAFGERFTSIRPQAPVRFFSTPGVDPGIGDPADALEVLLDLQWAGAVAPEAIVRAVIATPAADIPEALEVAVDQRLGDVISISYGICEPFAGPIVSEFLHELYARATLQGQTVVVASGDAGTAECAPASDVAAVNALAASPYVLAVGGTALDPLFDPDGRATGYGGEAVWQDEFGAGGGGLSAWFGSPAFQAPLEFPARALPDLALAASPAAPGYAVVRDGEALAVGGTSAGAPAMAGLLALATGMAGRPLGSVLPEVYRLATDDDGAGVFRDVVEGSNGFPALPGYDLATGWGSPMAETLVPALASAERPRCEPAWACSVPGTPQSSGCLLEWQLPGMELAVGASGLPTRKQRCRDGEPCDLDGVVNKSCTIDVALCLNLVDPRLRTKRGLRACLPRPLGTPKILRPGPASGHFGIANRGRLQEAARRFPPPPISTREACTLPVPIEVPIGVGSSYGTATLRAATGGKRGGKAKVTLRCERVL
ncbi:MAG TPA: S53 family peptidase [Candidatus Limnocylindria bacterium]|nr:S53 family peptidase [Candidatus Limnocylindria bacterium]